MSDSPAEAAVVISQQALGECIYLEREIHDLQEQRADLEHRVDRLEGDLDE
ncbi:hypothetical protein ACFQGT_10640 [Natrialbaceae archaeon GCM10025810]|uniref:hypothetical protein n=1 Tax=Halovalidus salilacus TaxID=3075124 RepID=UPI00360EBF39